MNARSKRLFSWLLVAAMLLAMLPASAPASAVEETETEAVRYPSGVTSYVAVCPVCKTNATWKPYHGENDGDTPLQSVSHLYLEKDETYASGKSFLVAYSKICFNLNGYNLTAEEGAKYAFAAAGEANFIDTYGGSVVTGNGTAAGGGAAIHGNSTSLKYHIYGGTWTKRADNTGTYVMHLSTKGGTINIYDGAVIDAGGDTAGGTALIRGSLKTDGSAQKATLNICGGEIKGGKMIIGGADSVHAGCATVNLYGGTVTGCNMTVRNGATVHAQGGVYTNPITAGAGTTVKLSSAPTLTGGLNLGSGVVADITNLHSNAKIAIATTQDSGVFTTGREDYEKLTSVFYTTDGAPVLVDTRNAFCKLSKGMALLDAWGKATLYTDAQAALTAYYAADGFQNACRLVAGEALTMTLSGDVYLDAAGNALTVNGSGKLYGMDSGNDTYKTCAAWTLGEQVIAQQDVTNPANGKRYLFAEGGYHRLELAITHVTLRTAGEPGMYYKAKIGCDELLAKQINGYGVALSLENMPGADFDQEEDVRYTVYDKAAFNALYADNQVATNSCVLTGILKTGNDQTENTANADSRVYANLYLRLGDSILLSDEKNAGKTVEDEGFDGIACSMLQLVNSIHKNWSKYSSANRMTLRSFVGNWKPYVEENTFPVLQNEIQVGFGRVDIVPTMSVPLAGYGQTHKRMSTGVQDRIYATCVAITEASGKTLLLISQDLIDSSWYLDAAAAIEAATGIPQEQIMISGTHTHAAPDIRSTLDCIKEYKAEYLAHMVAVAEQALADRSDALAYAGAAILEKMNSVRHYLMADGTYAGDNFGSFTNNTIVEPAEQADKELQVIRFVREGKAAISMMNWQAHVTFGTSSSSTLISSCFVGTARDHFEKTTGDLFIYFTGACGNVNARSKISGQNTGSNYREYGEVLSQTAINIIAGMEAESFITDFGTKKLTVTGQIDHSMEDKLEEAREVTAVYNAQGLSAGNKLAKQYGFSSAYHAQAVVRRSSYELTRDMDLYAFCLGDIAFIAAPYEMFAAHGLYIKEHTEGTVFLLTSGNGRHGYLPTNKAYDYGCYESHTGNYARGTGDQMAEAFVSMLKELS